MTLGGSVMTGASPLDGLLLVPDLGVSHPRRPRAGAPAEVVAAVDREGIPDHAHDRRRTDRGAVEAALDVDRGADEAGDAGVPRGDEEFQVERVAALAQQGQ